jgi:serine/threonine protein kinase
MLTQAQVGRFAIRDFLGRGAIGDVYLAWDPARESEIALKLVRTRGIDQDALAAERNGTALQAAIAKVAPQVAAVYDQGDQDGFFWVAMEYISGDDLAAVIERAAPFPEERAAGIALQLCEMLEMFHEFSAAGLDGRRGIVHGDLKPENIRLQEGDRVRVLDFGIAKHLSQTRKFTVNLFGSLPYVPPERLNTGRLDPQSDLWAVAVILYTTIAGYPPWPGHDPEELENRLRRGDPPVPLPQTCSPGLKRTVYRALAFDPARRYPSAAALRADLEAWRDGKLPDSQEPGSPDLPDRPVAELSATRRTVHPLEDSRAGGETRRTDGSAPAVPPVPGPDLDSTRRTYEPETARPTIVPPPPPAAPGSPLDSVPGPQPPIEKPRPDRRHRRRWKIALLGAVLILLGISQVWIQSEARELQHDLVADTDPDLSGILERYRKISWLGLFNPTLGSVRDELREALVHSADRVIDGYHAEYPRVRERGWQQAYDYLKGAMELNYLDRRTRAKMLYAKAHLDRIASQTLRQQGDKPAAEEKIDAAVAGFEDAARRDSKWPDPYLGLARVYAYERPDMERLQKALAELERRGYRLGRRERAMEADGYRRQAEVQWSHSIVARGTDSETEYLEKTRDNLLQAINFYDDASGYADVSANRAKAASRLRQVEQRLHPRAPESPDEDGLLDQIDEIFHQIEGATRQR